jgi:hypothetical protein
MLEYFQALGYARWAGSAGPPDRFVTRNEFMEDMPGSGAVLFILLKPKVDTLPICGEVTHTVCATLGIPSPGPEALAPSAWNPGNPVQGLEEGQNYLVFNNYVASGSLRLLPRDKARLEREAMELAARNGYRVVHVGSQGDKDSDPKVRPWVSLDFRGATGVKDLFSLMASPQVKEVVAYDTFVAHLAFMNGKSTVVLQRRSLPRIQFSRMRNRFLPPFARIEAGQQATRFLN